MDFFSRLAIIVASFMRAVPDSFLSFAVVDIETTGLRPPHAGITEVGAVILEEGRVAGSFHSLVDPARPIPRSIERLTGITDDMVAGQPSIEEILPELTEFLGDRVVAAHNAAFDFGFLDYEARRLWGRPLPQQRLCTVRLARRALPHLRSRSLDFLIAYLGVDCAGRHRALGDATATASVLLALLGSLKGRRQEVLASLIEPPTTIRKAWSRHYW